MLDQNFEKYSVDVLSDLSEQYGSQELNDLTYKIIGAAMEVHNTIGKGFSEAVYKECLCIELDKKGINYETEKKYEIVYKGVKINHAYFADLIVNTSVVVEIKAQSTLVEGNIKQLMNYLALSGCTIGLLINFGDDSLKFKRVILTKQSA